MRPASPAPAVLGDLIWLKPIERLLRAISGRAMLVAKDHPEDSVPQPMSYARWPKAVGPRRTGPRSILGFPYNFPRKSRACSKRGVREPEEPRLKPNALIATSIPV